MKRSRPTFESDLQAQQSPYVIYGTPLPPLDPDVRDDGSYVPVWKQEVTDEKGRKRLHGAFTGGFSAGYFNTVGSKEGWTPSTFVSSRSQRNKNMVRPGQRAEDFMDEEDLAEAEEAKKLQIADSFAGIGSRAPASASQDLIMDVFRPSGETIGVKLLRKMGWRDGEGIGPKVRRKVKAEDGSLEEDSEAHLFAPQDSQMISFNRKKDKQGLGFASAPGLTRSHAGEKEIDSPSGVEEGIGPADARGMNGNANKKSKQDVKGGFGMGILNDTGSDDDEDPYSMGPQISYNRTLGGEKKKKQKKVGKISKTSANPTLGNKPRYVSRKKGGIAGNPGFRQCHDGRLPIDGFILSTLSDPLDSILTQDSKYPAPAVPADFTPSRHVSENRQLVKAEDDNRTSKLDSKSRAALLGETPLPSKSVFDFLTPAGRSRIAAATSNESLPPARSGAVSNTSSSQAASVEPQIPSLPREAALAALGRGTAGWVPYADDPPKRARYVNFLEYQADLRGNGASPGREPNMRHDDWIKELQEFAHSATIFKPMSAAIASRFTSSSSSSSAPAIKKEGAGATSSLNDGNAQPSLLRQPKGKTPAEEAAAKGMYGPLTRTVENWFPTRLLCKRFNVKPPAHVQVDPGDDPKSKPASSSGFAQQRLDLVGKKEMDELKMAAASGPRSLGFMSAGFEGGSDRAMKQEEITEFEREVVSIDPEKNEALEKSRPGDEVFRAIFGSDSEDD